MLYAIAMGPITIMRNAPSEGGTAVEMNARIHCGEMSPLCAVGTHYGASRVCFMDNATLKVS